MAWTNPNLSAEEIAWAGDDKPMLSSNSLQSVDASDIDAKWIKGKTNGVWSDTDGADADYPMRQLWDGLPHLEARPDAAVALSTIVINVSASPIDFDWFGILNHNLDSSSCTSLTVQVADSGDFLTRPQTVISAYNPSALSSDRRFSVLSLSPGNVRYQDVGWIRIAMSNASAVLSIGQMIFGRSRQQKFNPVLPWDPQAQVSSMDEIVLPNMTRDRNPRYKARRELEASFRHSCSFQQNDTIAFWDDIRQGSDPFYIHDNPSSLSNDFYMMFFREPALQYPWTSAVTRDLQISAFEQGPNFFSLE